MTDHCAYWNPDRMAWEILLDRPAGDRYEKVAMHIETAHKILKEQGVKFIPAKYGGTFVQQAHMLVIIDYKYWLTNEQDINHWCKESDIVYTSSGMTLEFNTEEDKLMFILRWG